MPLLGVVALATLPCGATPRRPLPFAACVALGDAGACSRVATGLTARLLGGQASPADRLMAEALARATVAVLRAPATTGPLADTLSACRASDAVACMQLADVVDGLFALEDHRLATSANNHLARAVAGAILEAAMNGESQVSRSTRMRER